MRIIDLSHPLDVTTPVYPGDPPVQVTRLMTAGADGAPYTLHAIAASLHAGTHADAPAHFLPRGPSIEQVALDRCVGQALRIALPKAAETGSVGAADLQPFEARLRQVRRAVLHTGWSAAWGTARYFSAHPVLTGEAAAYLADSCGLRALGLDFPSPDHSPFPAHPVLLRAGVLLVENLCGLEQVPDVFEWIVLPLPLRGLEASPVRAVAVVRGDHP